MLNKKDLRTLKLTKNIYLSNTDFFVLPDAMYKGFDVTDEALAEIKQYRKELHELAYCDQVAGCETLMDVVWPKAPEWWKK